MITGVRLAAIAFSLSIVACSATPAPAASPSGPEKVAITDKTAGELVAVMQAWQTALSKKDLTGFQATIDLTRAAFRRCQSETFDIASRQGFNQFDVKVAKVEPYLDSYARAYVGDDTTGYSRLYFRREGGKWIRSEPLDSELGGDQTKTINGLQLSYYGIDSDVIDTYATAGSDTRTFLLQQAEGHTATGQAFGLRIFPTRGAAGPTVGCSVAGFHLPNTPNDVFIRLFSNALSFKPGLASVTDSTASIIKHEGLHWLQDQFIPGISARLPFWLVEGWPDFVGQSRSQATKKNVICNTPTPTYKQLEDGVLQTPETPPELPGQYYAFGNTMVEYAYKIGGGAKAYWDLMTVYKAGVDAKVNLPKVLGVTPEAFYSGWIAWAKQTYC
ncbi:MAG: hypothetical protein QOH08_196 [Chloroflexota bacterium]|nr:hypothetical protein [Chloroflexota bacterium]